MCVCANVLRAYDLSSARWRAHAARLEEVFSSFTKPSKTFKELCTYFGLYMLTFIYT